MRETLEYVLEDELSQAVVLKHNDHDHDARIIKRICKRVADSAADYLTFVTEKEAILRTGRTVEYLRGRFPKWEARGHARKIGGARSYRQIVLESRLADSALVRANARAIARKEGTGSNPPSREHNR